MDNFMKTGLMDFKEIDALKSASREDLEQWYIFQSQCLMCLVAKHMQADNAVIIDAEDMPRGDLKLYFQPIDPQRCFLFLKDVSDGPNGNLPNGQFTIETDK